MRFSLLFVLLVSAQFVFAQNAAPTNSTPVSARAVLVNLSKPAYPPLARMAGIFGDVSIEVTISQNGSVVEAIAVTGHPMLKPAALDSARNSRWECRNCDGNAKYLLTYSYKSIETGDCCSASPDSTVEQKPEVLKNGLPETEVIISTEHRCICDPSADVSKHRSIKCLYLWKCAF